MSFKSDGRILVVEDEETISGIVCRALTASGFEALPAADGASAIELAQSTLLLAIVLDLMLPDANGLELIPRLRQHTSAPIIALTARGDWQDKVLGLESGADDYMAKPFRVEELCARIKAQLRRSSAQNRFIQVGELCIDLLSRQAFMAGRKLYLSSTEFQLLELLAERVGTIVSREEILERVWQDPHRDSNVVEVYINYLRHKVHRREGPKYIANVRGKGYVLSADIE